MTSPLTPPPVVLELRAWAMEMQREANIRRHGAQEQATRNPAFTPEYQDCRIECERWDELVRLLAPSDGADARREA